MIKSNGLSKPCKFSGIGLIELIVALCLSSLILVLLTKYYLVVKQQYLKVIALIRHQLEVETVIDLLRSSIRQAGFTPCLSIDKLTTFDSRYPANPLVALIISHQTQASLKIAYMSAYFETVKAMPNSNQLLTSARYNLQNQDEILIADCQHAEVQTIAALQRSKTSRLVTLSQPLHFNYKPPIYLGRWIEEKYFIHADKTKRQSLYYEQHHHSEELSHRIETMDITLAYQAGHKLVSLLLYFKQDTPVIVQTRVRMP